MNINPSLIVDWANGDGRVDLGQKFQQAHPILQLDLLGDWQDDLADALDVASEAMYPGLEKALRLEANLERRLATESLIGQAIASARVLQNGHVVIELAGGRVVVLEAVGPVHLTDVDSIDYALEAASKADFGTHFLDEPLTSLGTA